MNEKKKKKNLMNEKDALEKPWFPSMALPILN